MSDLDGRKYLDFCHMGVGTNILGYSNTYIDNKVKKVVSKGNMSTLNCLEEVDLCEVSQICTNGQDKQNLLVLVERHLCRYKNCTL